MPRRSSTKRVPKDESETTARIVALVTEDGTEIPIVEGKNPAAVALGRLGGKKGGKARADALSPKRRREIARNAAKRRWSKRENDDGDF